VREAVHIALAVAFTAGLYAGCSWLRDRLRLRLAHPVLPSVVLGCTLFALLPPTWLDAYLEGSAPIRWMLGPATAALALPFFRKRAVLAAHPWPVVSAVVTGVVSSVATGWVVGSLLGLPREWLGSAALKSVTLPVALGLSDLAHLDAGITTLCVFVAGLVGSAVGPVLLSWVGVRAPLARGLALGTLSHAIGTARALEEDTLAGAAGVVALTLAAVLMAIATMVWVTVAS
jgi:putative effector of murein hydrolase